MGLGGLKFSLCNSYGLKVLGGSECLGAFSAVAAVAAARGRILQLSNESALLEIT